MSFRWRVARALVGPIIRDPLPDKDGCAVIVRAQGLTAVYRPTKFRIRSRSRLNPRLFRFDPDRSFGDTYSQVTTFAGILTR